MRVARKAVVVAAAIAVFGTVAHGHDIAVFPTAGPDGVRLRVRYGHPGDYQDTVAGKLVTLDAHSPAGDRRSYAGRLRPDGITLVTAPLADVTAPGTWVFSTFYDNGFFLRTDDGRSVNTTRAEYPPAKAASHNIKYGKGLLAVGQSGPGFDRVIGHRLELVPKQDPFAAGAGSLDVLVLFDSKPLSGAPVVVYPEAEADEPLSLKTNAEGMVKVPLDRTGTFIVGAEHGVPSRHPDFATRDAYAASLVFTRS